MINPNSITTYAQYNEDLILAALLYNVRNGFYVDIGAGHPVIDSTTNYFYKQGWHGINIEPLKRSFQELSQARPKDVNINIGIGKNQGKIEFREYTQLQGHSTFSSKQKKEHSRKLKHINYDVSINTLQDVLSKYKPKHIHFLKIDVEGFEYQVIAGNNWNEFRPEVICIEANHISKNWHPILTKHNYQVFIFDGLNEYYIAKESWHRTTGFAERVIKLDYRTLKQHQQQSWQMDTEELVRVHKVAKEQQDIIKNQEQQLATLRAITTLTLKNQPWVSRLKRAVYGLTIDWVRHKVYSKKKINRVQR